MASILIDVDLDEFDTDDLIEELSDRKKRLSESQKKEIAEIVNNVYQPKLGINTMKDEMKMEYFLEHFAKITLEDLESLIKL